MLTDDGEVLTSSGTYRHKKAALDGVATFRANLAAAAVEDQTKAFAHPAPGSLPPI